MTTLYDTIEKLADACATMTHLADAYDDLRDAAAALLTRTPPGYDYELEQLRAALARVDSA